MAKTHILVRKNVSANLGSKTPLLRTGKAATIILQPITWAICASPKSSKGRSDRPSVKNFLPKKI